MFWYPSVKICIFCMLPCILEVCSTSKNFIKTAWSFYLEFFNEWVPFGDSYWHLKLLWISALYVITFVCVLYSHALNARENVKFLINPLRNLYFCIWKVRSNSCLIHLNYPFFFNRFILLGIYIKEFLKRSPVYFWKHRHIGHGNGLNVQLAYMFLHMNLVCDNLTAKH